MSYPPSFPSRMPFFPRPQMIPRPAFQFQNQKFGFFSPATHHLNHAMPPSVPGIHLVPSMGMNVRMEAPPVLNHNVVSSAARKNTVTTVFVGHISEKCSDDLIKKILQECGLVVNWKRLDNHGKFQSFGLCDFESPSGAINALEVLNGFLLGERRLNITVEESTKKLLEDFKKEKEVKKSDDSNNATDSADVTEKIRDKIRLLIESTDSILLKMPEELPTPIEGQNKTDEPTKSPRKLSKDRNSKRRRRSSRSPSIGRRRPKSPASDEHSRRSRRSVRSSSSYSSSSSLSVKRSRRRDRRSRRSRSPSHRSRTKSSSVDSYEKRKMKKEIREKEESYQKRLKAWEERERRMARQYTKDEEVESERQKTIHKEAKKLRQFLEDYEDERDDPKFYRGSSLNQRKRNYEREREVDAKDRHEEQREVEELRRMLIDDVKVKKKVYDDDKMEDQQKSWENGIKVPAGTWEAVGEPVASLKQTPEQINEKMEVETPSPSISQQKSGSKLVTTTITKPSSIQQISTVFGEDDEEEDTIHQIKKKIKPFEITREDRMQSMTTEERRKMIKDLIDRIPTSKDQLFVYPISWEYVDNSLIENRVKPWVNKKIYDYIGEEEPSLVAFICEKVSAKIEPARIMQDLSMVLDDESEVFMVKLWRLIIYESDAKKLGLNSNPGQMTAVKA